MGCSGGPTFREVLQGALKAMVGSRVGLLPKTAAQEMGDRKFRSRPVTSPVSWVPWPRDLSKGDAALAPKMLGLGRGAGERKNLDPERSGHVR